MKTYQIDSLKVSEIYNQKPSIGLNTKKITLWEVTEAICFTFHGLFFTHFYPEDMVILLISTPKILVFREGSKTDH